MRFHTPLVKGILIQRYKRFLADARLETGEVTTVYCANPGSMLTLKTLGSEIWLSKIPDHINRKLRYEWQLICVDDHLVGINTSLPNLLVEEALKAGLIEELKGYTQWRREVKYGKNSRIDFLLEDPGRRSCYLEVKNVNHKEGRAALFPDSVTLRGAKHLEELIQMVKGGHRAVVLYVVQRQDCEQFGLADEIDPHYARMAREAKIAGVEFLCYSCHVSCSEINIAQALPQNEL